MHHREPVTDLHAGENPMSALAERYLSTLLRSLDPRHLDARVIENLLRCDALRDPDEPDAGIFHGGRRESAEPPRTQLKRRIAALTKRRGRDASAAPTGFVAENLSAIAALLDFDETDRALLAFVVALHTSPTFREVAEAFGGVSVDGAVALVAAGVALPAAQMRRALREGRAVRSGLVEVGADATRDFADRLSPKDGLVDLVLTPGLDRDAVIARFLPVAPPSALRWSDVATVSNDVALVRELLRSALRARTQGVNVLLYGPTGTGKTECARLLAAEIGAALHVAAAGDASGEGLSASERVSSLLLGQRLLRSGNALMLFDELEDLFGWDLSGSFKRVPRVFRGRAGGSATLSKAWFNQFLEENPVPTIWISNEVRDVDPAFLRRFAFAVEFRAPGSAQRARVLGRHLGPTDAVSAAEVDAIAARYALPPATLRTAVVAARLIAPDGAADRARVERVLAPMERLLCGSRAGAPLDFDPATFRLDAIQCPVDLDTLVTRLADWRPDEGPGITLCLHGPPGTGKSEFVRYLAHRMGRPVVHRRVSDLQSKWVGETEKAIAAAFIEAENDGAVLLFDEADSFLRDRRSANHSWEVTQVNEFLQRLECFRGVAACTTNLVEDLDPAAVRRFVFKLAFAYLSTAQALVLFDALLAPLAGTALDERARRALGAELGRVGALTPGDFAAVRRRFRALHATPTPTDCVEELAREVSARVAQGARAMHRMVPEGLA